MTATTEVSAGFGPTDPDVMLTGLQRLRSGCVNGVKELQVAYR